MPDDVYSPLFKDNPTHFLKSTDMLIYYILEYITLSLR